jgi:hypothetical protein
LAEGPERRPEGLRRHVVRTAWALRPSEMPIEPRQPLLTACDRLTVSSFDAEVGELLDQFGHEVAGALAEDEDDA